MTSPKTALQQSWPSLSKPNKRVKGRIRPSSLSNGCLLVSYYDMTDAESLAETRSADEMMMLDVGTFIHEQIQEGFTRFYESIGWGYFPETRAIFSSTVSGSCDATLVSDEGRVEAHEYKTCSSNVFKSLSKPMDSHILQFQLYMACVAAEKGWILYVCRDNLAQKEFEVAPNPEKVLEIQKMVAEIEDSVAKGIPPVPKVKYFGRKPCTKSCGYRHLCPAAAKKKGAKFHA